MGCGLSDVGCGLVRVGAESGVVLRTGEELQGPHELCEQRCVRVLLEEQPASGALSFAVGHHSVGQPSRARGDEGRAGCGMGELVCKGESQGEGG